jgi:arsenate reductase
MAKSLFETKSFTTGCRAVSCGVIEGSLDGFVVAVLKEKGIDISSHEAQVFEALDPADFELIISFSREAEYKARRWANKGCETLFWDVRPPQTDERSRDTTLESYRQISDQIDRLLTDYFA